MTRTPIPPTSMATTRAIYALTTGGTMEKVYSEQTGSVANVDSKIDRYLGLLRLPDYTIHHDDFLPSKLPEFLCKFSCRRRSTIRG